MHRVFVLFVFSALQRSGFVQTKGVSVPASSEYISCNFQPNAQR